MNDKTILLSALVVADGKPDAVLESVVGLKTRFSDPERMQILLRVSDEDQDMLVRLPEFKEHGITTIVRPPSPDPYPRGSYLNELAEKATGYWLFPFDSNATMVTGNWDIPLHRIRDEACMAYFNEVPKTGEPYTYPVITRNIYEECGHITLISHWSDWLRNLISLSGLRNHYLSDVTLSIVRRADDVSNSMDFTEEVTEALRTDVKDASALVQFCIQQAGELRELFCGDRCGVAYYR